MNDLVKAATEHVWLMDPKHLKLMMDKFESIPQASLEAAINARIEAGTAQAFDNLQAAASGRPGEAKPKAEVRDGVAHIRVAGPILKQVPSIFKMLGIDAASTEDIRGMLSDAALDEGVKSIMLDIDSPGGTIDGVEALAADIFAARDIKPVHAHASDLMASAAYWIGSQAGTLTAGPTAAVGSIGVYTVMDDTSAIVEGKGIRKYVISSHPLKGAGLPGSRITDDQRDDAQRIIDGYADLFVGAVARGRGVSVEAIEKLAGKVWLGQEAADLGLVDGIEHSDNAHFLAGGKQSALRAPRETARLSAGMESDMDIKEMESLRAENAKLRARVEADEAIAQARAVAERKELVAKYADRVPPSAAASVEKFVATLTTEEAESYLADMPKIVRDAVTGVDAKQKIKTVVDGALASLSGRDLFTGTEVGGQAGAEQVARLLGTTVEAIDRYSDVAHGYSNGTFRMKDGRIVTAEELKKMKAA